MSLATPDYDGMQHAFPTLEPAVRKGLIVLPLIEIHR
jgi:hypothetical protein